MLIIPYVAMAASNTTYTAMIAQGNTNDQKDCVAFFKGLKRVPNNNAYIITNPGFTYNDGVNTWLNEVRAGAADLVDAGNKNVLYWSGHGGRGNVLNEIPSDPTKASGTYNRFTVGTALDLNNTNWMNTSKWKGKPLAAVIFAACYQLDSTSVTTAVRAMKSSNVRIIAGYHESGPTHPTDVTIANNFFNNNRNNVKGGVENGESIKSSWQIANEISNAHGTWAVLAYTSNNNQYYRIPGFPGNEYAPPAAGSAVYRYWKDYITTPQPTSIGTTSLENLPPTLEATKAISLNVQSEMSKSMSTIHTEGIQVANIREQSEGVVIDSVQQSIVDSFIGQAVPFDLTGRSLLSISEVHRAEAHEDSGILYETDIIIGKTYSYSNQFNGIRIVDNFIKVGTDAEGVYFVINKWTEVAAKDKYHVGAKNILPLQSSLGNDENGEAAVFVSDLMETSERIDGVTFTVSDQATAHQKVTRINTSRILSTELVYAPSGNGEYFLAYEVRVDDGNVYYVCCADGNVTQ